MHRKLCSFFALLLAMSPLTAETRRVTIVADFEGPYSEKSVAQMKSEVASVLSHSGLTVDWRSLAEARGNDFNELVVVRFKGKCVLEPVAYLYYDERGPLASTETANGEVLPFSQVACDRVTSTMRKALYGGDYAKADQLLGRALGRVVAHELIHIYADSGVHSQEGVGKESLSPQQLVARRLELSEADALRLQNSRR